MTHGLYQSLESEKVNRVSREPIDTSKQFESIEPNRILPAASTSFEASKRPSPDRKKSSSRSPPRKMVKNIINKYGYQGESDVDAIERINGAACVIQRSIGRYLEHKQLRAVTNSEDQSQYDHRLVNDDESSYGHQDQNQMPTQLPVKSITTEQN